MAGELGGEKEGGDETMMIEGDAFGGGAVTGADGGANGADGVTGGGAVTGGLGGPDTKITGGAGCGGANGDGVVPPILELVDEDEFVSKHPSFGQHVQALLLS